MRSYTPTAICFRDHLFYYLYVIIFRYLNTYRKYIDLMNNKADQEVTAFLKETHAIPGFRKVCLLLYYCLTLIYLTPFFICNLLKFISVCLENISFCNVCSDSHNFCSRMYKTFAKLHINWLNNSSKRKIQNYCYSASLSEEMSMCVIVIWVSEWIWDAHVLCRIAATRQPKQLLIRRRKKIDYYSHDI